MLSRELIASGRTLQCTPRQARSSAAPSLSPALDHARPAIERLSGWSIVANTSFNVKARPMINRCGKERRIGSDLFGVRCGAEAHCANAVHGRCCAVCTDARVSCCATGHQCLFVCWAVGCSVHDAIELLCTVEGLDALVVGSGRSQSSGSTPGSWQDGGIDWLFTDCPQDWQATLQGTDVHDFGR